MAAKMAVAPEVLMRDVLWFLAKRKVLGHSSISGHKMRLFLARRGVCKRCPPTIYMTCNKLERVSFKFRCRRAIEGTLHFVAPFQL